MLGKSSGITSSYVINSFLVIWVLMSWMGSKSLFFTSRHQTGDVAPQGRYSETTVFASGAPQLANFLEKNNTVLKIA